MTLGAAPEVPVPVTVARLAYPWLGTKAGQVQQLLACNCCLSLQHVSNCTACAVLQSLEAVCLINSSATAASHCLVGHTICST